MKSKRYIFSFSNFIETGVYLIERIVYDYNIDTRIDNLFLQNIATTMYGKTISLGLGNRKKKRIKNYLKLIKEIEERMKDKNSLFRNIKWFR